MSWSSFENKHAGERCFILGNAPSLKEENLSLLKNEKVFVCNRGYHALDLGLDHYDYYVITDVGVYKADAGEIQEKSRYPRFYHEDIRREQSYLNGVREEHIPIRKLNQSQKSERKATLQGKFPQRFEDGWGKVGTVVLDAALIAYFMGFTKIYLLGVDLFYTAGNTHFYKPGQRENNIRDGHEPKARRFIPRFNYFFQDRGVTFVNLSKGFKIENLMPTDRLENIFTK
jgi:hypothetical protein